MHPEVPVIMLTGLAERDMDLAAMQAGATTELIDEAQSLADELRSTPPHTPQRNNAADVLLGFLAAERADREAAAELHASILPCRGQADVIVGMSNYHVLGLLAQTAGRPDEAVEHFEDALAP